MMGRDGYERPRPSWRCTLVTQAALCLALYAAFSIGRPRADAKPGRDSLDLYFLSVVGGPRPLKEQTQLLQRMEKAVRTYKAKFVVNIGKLGDDDPLTENGTLHFPLLKIPWFTTSASRGKVMRNFFKQIKIPHGQVLDIIGVDTGPLQDVLHVEKLSGTGSDQLHWMQRTLAATNSNWRIFVGFDPLVVCKGDNSSEKVEFYEPVRNVFLRYGVNAYMSQHGCTENHRGDKGIMYIGNPGHADKECTTQSSKANSHIISEICDGFLLHRVSPLEIESYLIDSAGKEVSKSSIHQLERGSM